MFTKEQLLILFPNAPEKEIKQAIKYQEKFNLTLDNLNCLNPDCNNIRKWNTSSTKFNYCCSDPVCFEKMKATIDSIRCNKNVGKILSHTSLNKRKNTNLNKSIEEKKLIQNKREQTCLKKYGVINQNMNPEILEKRKNTVKNISNDIKAISIKKGKETYYNRTGYNHPLSNPKNRISLNPNYKHITNFEQWNDKQFWIDNFITTDNNFDYIKCTNYFNCLQPAAHNQIKKLDIEYSKIGGTSLKEQALYPFLDSLNFIYETNVRNVIDNLELDIYLPELDLAIEYNGLYWHSYHEAIGTSPKQLDFSYMKYRHQNKSLACINNGIRLLHIYEDTINIENLILDFINYEACNQEGSLKEPKSYELDSGCYPLGLEYEILEPESRIVLGDRLLFNAGKIKTKK